MEGNPNMSEQSNKGDERVSLLDLSRGEEGGAPLPKPRGNGFSRSGKTKDHVLPGSNKIDRANALSSQSLSSVVSGVVDLVCDSVGTDGVLYTKRPKPAVKPRTKSGQRVDINVSFGVKSNKTVLVDKPQLNTHWDDWTTLGLAQLIAQPDLVGTLSHDQVAASIRANDKQPIYFRCKGDNCLKKFVYPICMKCPLMDQFKTMFSDKSVVEDFDSIEGKGVPERSEERRPPAVPPRQSGLPPAVDSKLVASGFRVLVDEAADLHEAELSCGLIVQPKNIPKPDRPIRNLSSFFDGFVSQAREKSAIIERPVVFWKRPFKRSSRFDVTKANNHTIGALMKHKDQSHLASETIPDAWIITELYQYLIMKRMEAYPDRAAQLAHMSRLATKWAFETKFNQTANTELTNKLWVTVQKATDADDVKFLLKETKPDHQRNSIRLWISHKLTRLNR